MFVAAAGALAVERVAYGWIYNNPQRFAIAARRVPIPGGLDPVSFLELLFFVFKLVQAAVFVAWCLEHGGVVVSSDRALALTTGVTMIGAGQYLNLRVFQLLGREGVFFGNRFGLVLPWQQRFPFSWMRHPQYVGASLTIWGLFLALRFPAADWIVLPLLETAYYAAGSLFETDRDVPGTITPADSSAASGRDTRTSR
jgi:methylene-fatty-acyl-phospholipid synthase